MKSKQKDSTTTVLWFRRDFRLQNNPAFNFAISQRGPVLAVYIENTGPDLSWRPGAASRWWCHNSLLALSDKLAEQGVELKYFRGDAGKLIPSIIHEAGATSICWNRLYEPDELKLDQSIEQSLDGLAVHKFDSHLLFPPGTLLNQQDQAYRVFTPFWKKARVRLDFEGVNPVIRKPCNKITGYTKRLRDECSLEKLGLLDEHNWHTKLEQHWVPGEDAALKTAKRFIKNKIESYETQRDIPSVQGTSRLSPHLHFGEITTTQFVSSLLKEDWPGTHLSSVERCLTQLGWREFSHHILWHFPHTVSKPMNDKFKNFWPKKGDHKYLNAWKTGTTGISIVDAGMRELWETGSMHNRVRMIVASFLTKNLGIHWLHGAKWFWDTLVDADLANNTLGWQWVAGCGVDAAPYYRVFNPYTQTKKFDEEQKYIKKWIPEIDAPSLAPIVDIKKSRVVALEKYRKISTIR